jgi:two-component system nitrogen regulation response regulator GlnG
MVSDILIVDDDPTILRVISMMLTTEDFGVRVASTVSQALEMSAKETPLMVISDMLMPGGTGIDLITEYRKDPALAQLPVICITGSGDSSMVEQAMVAGAFACLGKPFSKPQLLDMVRLALQDRQ